MAKSSTRRVTIYINGKEVEASVKQIRSEMNKLVNEQNRMVIGSDEYISHAKKIKELRRSSRRYTQGYKTFESYSQPLLRQLSRGKKRPCGRLDNHTDFSAFLISLSDMLSWCPLSYMDKRTISFRSFLWAKMLKYITLAPPLSFILRPYSHPYFINIIEKQSS